jgi:uncharacterized protein (TIGR01777 family)
MNILITGGTGLIGRALTRSMTADDHTVMVLSRSQRWAPPESQVRYFTWDARTSAGWEEALQSADAVVHLAGENIGGGLWTPDRKERILNSRVSTGRALVEGLRQTGARPRVFVQASGIGIYGTSENQTFREGDRAGSDFVSEVAQAWEASTDEIEAMGVRRILARIGPVLDAKSGILPLMALPFRLFVGGPVGSGQQWLSWIHIQDQINALRFLLEHEATQGVYNLCAPNPVTNAEMGRAFARVLGRPYWFPTPAFALRIVLGEMSTLVLDGQRAVPERLQQAGFTFQFPEIEAALRDLYGHVPRLKAGG